MEIYKGVGTVRAIFGPVKDTSVFVIFCLKMLYLSKILCFKSVCLVFYILGLKEQKTTKNHRFLEKFNIFYIVMSKILIACTLRTYKATDSYFNTILTFAKYNCLFLGKKHQFLTFFHRFLEIFYILLVTHCSTVTELWLDITLAETSKNWIIWQFVRNKTFILGRKHQFLTLFHRFLEIFYNSLVTHYSNVNELWFDIILADTSTKSIIWQFVNNETFILGRKHQFLTLFHRFLEIFYNFLVAHHSNVKELWLDITLADTSTKWIIWQFIRNNTFILGKNINFWHFFTDFWKYFITLL